VILINSVCIGCHIWEKKIEDALLTKYYKRNLQLQCANLQFKYFKYLTDDFELFNLLKTKPYVPNSVKIYAFSI
jgi:hypothetical protein